MDLEVPHPFLTILPPIRSYGSFVHSLVRLRASRRQYFGTYFFRNRPELELIRGISADSKSVSSLNSSVMQANEH